MRHSPGGCRVLSGLIFSPLVSGSCSTDLCCLLLCPHTFQVGSCLQASALPFPARPLPPLLVLKAGCTFSLQASAVCSDAVPRNTPALPHVPDALSHTSSLLHRLPSERALCLAHRSVPTAKCTPGTWTWPCIWGIGGPSLSTYNRCRAYGRRSGSVGLNESVGEPLCV